MSPEEREQYHAEKLAAHNKRQKLDVARTGAMRREPKVRHVPEVPEAYADQAAHEMRMNRPRIITARAVQQAMMDGKACPCCLAINGQHRSACLYRAFERAHNQQGEMHEAIQSARRFATELLRQLR